MTDWIKNFPEQEGEIFVFRRYGLAPSVVFRDSNLSIGAKALYGYLATFVNAEEMKKGLFKAWPSRKRILHDLNISGNTLSKYLKELQNANLIKVEQGRRTLQEGRQVYSNNHYILLPYITMSEEEKRRILPDDHLLEQHSNSRSDQLKSCATHEVDTSNTQGFSNTKNKSNIFSSQNRSQTEKSQTTIPLTEENHPSPINSDQLVHALIEFWNEQEINPHPRLGAKTKLRIQRALNEALEDYTWDELLNTIKNYSKLYQDQRCNHKYRLVEFLEKRGYEHFLHEENWTWRPRKRITRDDFTYSVPQQDLSFFSFLDDYCKGDAS